MASRSSAIAALNVVALLVLCGLPATTEAHTQFGAYNKTCPQAEEIVFKEMTAILAKSPDLAGPVLRLFSVDCLLGVSPVHRLIAHNKHSVDGRY
jgi:peroxidase